MEWFLKDRCTIRRVKLLCGRLPDAPPAASPVLVLSGRYPGSQVLICRLPMITHSGILANPHLLTVAGAAQALGTLIPAPASRLTRMLLGEHLKAARTLSQSCSGLQKQNFLSAYKLLAYILLTI